jgi:hypothetical protein
MEKLKIEEKKAQRFQKNALRGPLLIPFGIPTQVFFSDTPRVAETLAEAQGAKNRV